MASPFFSGSAAVAVKAKAAVRVVRRMGFMVWVVGFFDGCIRLKKSIAQYPA
jgi:hypothetical protein